MNLSSPAPRRFAAALFDFDETMIDLEHQHDAAHRALCEAMGSRYDDMPESFRFGSGRRIIDDVREMRDHFGWTASLEELNGIRHRAFLDECRRGDLRLMASVEDVVRDLHSRGLRLAITSSAAGDAIDEIITRFGLRDYFELIVDGSEVTRGKPDPEAYLLTARKLGVNPEECIVFEDSERGVGSAKNAGMFCVAIRNPRARSDQDLSRADVILGSLAAFDASRFGILPSEAGHRSCAG